MGNTEKAFVELKKAVANYKAAVESEVQEPFSLCKSRVRDLCDTLYCIEYKEPEITEEMYKAYCKEIGLKYPKIPNPYAPNAK